MCIRDSTKFESQVYVLTKEEGGRHTPFFPGYRPQFYVRTTDVTGKIESFISDDGEEASMVMPGDRVKMIVELIQPIAIENGMRFAIREGGRTVGAGVVSTNLKKRINHASQHFNRWFSPPIKSKFVLFEEKLYDENKVNNGSVTQW